jgi:hypothetical protein
LAQIKLAAAIFDRKGDVNMAKKAPVIYRALWKEPLLHFALIGSVVFGGYHWLHGFPKNDDQVEPIHVGEGDLKGNLTKSILFRLFNELGSI